MDPNDSAISNDIVSKFWNTSYWTQYTMLFLTHSILIYSYLSWQVLQTANLLRGPIFYTGCDFWEEYLPDIRTILFACLGIHPQRTPNLFHSE